ncbi:hypothetical protein BpHYR1_008676 [Brachionus plicatilis]|uniref:Uncharacterized protein n=1 Tax=Brachionus plicatilis TaxID=10195 RepID=A0A3M7QGA8_BRAPC|nr:hypothetical protein BpHYR1_008676 [Brachionus plicatilis]
MNEKTTFKKKFLKRAWNNEDGEEARKSSYLNTLKETRLREQRLAKDKYTTHDYKKYQKNFGFGRDFLPFENETKEEKMEKAKKRGEYAKFVKERNSDKYTYNDNAAFIRRTQNKKLDFDNSGGNKRQNRKLGTLTASNVNRVISIESELRTKQKEFKVREEAMAEELNQLKKLKLNVSQKDGINNDSQTENHERNHSPPTDGSGSNRSIESINETQNNYTPTFFGNLRYPVVTTYKASSRRSICLSINFSLILFGTALISKRTLVDSCVRDSLSQRF